MLGENWHGNKTANQTSSRKKIANYMLSREVKPNFKEMEKSSECQKDFSMHYSSLA